MKNKLFAFALFCLCFAAGYLLLSFALPGMRIKLEAEPLEYFIKSLGHMGLVKAAVSLGFSALVQLGLLFAAKKR